MDRCTFEDGPAKGEMIDLPAWKQEAILIAGDHGLYYQRYGNRLHLAGRLDQIGPWMVKVRHDKDMMSLSEDILQDLEFTAKIYGRHQDPYFNIKFSTGQQALEFYQCLQEE